MRVLMTMTLTGAAVWPVAASEVRLSIEIPQLTVAEYHRPYVAVWLERADQSFVGNVAVWYDLKLKDNEGTKWLKDLRQWWRRSGRELSMPVDGLSTVTRPPGNHQLKIDTAKVPFAGLPDGSYQMVVEASREVGGRELLRIPFQWPLKDTQSVKAPGQHELGAVVLDLKP